MIESPIRYEKKEQKIVIQTDELKPGTCKIVEVKEGFLKSKKFVICVSENLKKITIEPIEIRDG